MVKMVTSLQNFSKSHPNNNVVLMFDQDILYANHYEKQQGQLDKEKLYKGIDYKTFIKNDLNYLDLNVVDYWHHNKVKYEVKYSNFFNDSDFMYYYPLYKIMEEMNITTTFTNTAKLSIVFRHKKNRHLSNPNNIYPRLITFEQGTSKP